MKYQFKALEKSIAIHAIVILAIIVMSNSFEHRNRNNLIVIDFTIEDSVDKEARHSRDASYKPARGSGSRNHKPEGKSQKLRKIEKKLDIEEPKLKTTAPVIQISEHASSTVTQEQVLAYSKQILESKNEGTRDNSLGFSEDAHNGEDREVSFGGEGSGETGANMTYVGGSSNMGNMGNTGYLRANFSYIKDMIEKRITYPQNARRMGWEGKVKVSFIISSSGQVRDITIIQSSGYKILDSNVIEAVYDASPFPKPPVEAQIIIPIVYSLH